MKRLVGFIAAGLAAVSISHAALADGGAKFLGNITTGGQIRPDMGTYWNQITAENGCKWGSIHSLDENGKSKFAWDNYDKCEGAYNWAKEKPGERHFKFHALVWGSQYPRFLCKGENPGITVEKTRQYITEWFDAVAAKFPDLEYIDVVNEAIWAGSNYHSGYLAPAAGAEGVTTDDEKCGGSYIIEALGGDRVVGGKHQYDFITTAFKMARERWPKAVLIYNDYNTFKWQKREGIELVQTIINNGAPVDAYGQQAHDAADFPDANSFKNVLKEIHDAVKIPLFITEYDVGADDNTQKNIISNQIPFLWETPWIAGITIWGYINGSTWRQNTGIMNSNGTDRPAMTWLKQYFAENLNKGQNTTGFGGSAPVEPVPQKPFGGKPWGIPGKIEAEDFDIPGIGRNNNSYSDTDAGNNACMQNNQNFDADCKDNYREDTDVDIKTSGTGHVIGWNATGEWLEYTVNVDEGGDFSLFVAASSGNGGSYKFATVDADGKVTDLTDPIEVAASSDPDNYNDFAKNAINVKLEKGTQIIRLIVVEQYIDIDYFTLVRGKDATDPEPIGGFGYVEPPEEEESIAQGVRFSATGLEDYDVFDMQGAFMGRLSAYSVKEAISIVKSSSVVKGSGVYQLRSRSTGKVQAFRIAR